MNRSRVVHNALLNFLALAIPLGLAFFVMPVAAHRLGPARFGLLGLAWAITEYLTLFDLGLGRALVKFVADALHVDAGKVPHLISLGIVAQLVAGILGGAVFFAAAPLIVRSAFRVSPEISAEALGVFRVVALSLPIVLLMAAERAVLEGAQRFDLSASIKMIGSVVSLVIPAVGAALGASLTAIFAWILVVRVLLAAVYAAAIARALPEHHWEIPRDWALLRTLLSFGGWVLVSNTVSPLLVYFDRFALTSIAGLAAAGFYTAPYEGVVRLLILPVSLFGSLLPALTSSEAAGDERGFVRVTASTERVLAPTMAAPLIIIAVFAPELLRLWLGDAYAVQSATALRWLAGGVFANALANPLFASLYAKNRPDLPAKFHIAELLIHIPLTIYLIRDFGITGAAAAWTIRVTLDLCLLWLAAARVSRVSLSAILGGKPAETMLTGAVLLIALSATRLTLSGYPTAMPFVALLALVVFGGWQWRRVLTEQDRAALAATIRSYTRR